MNSSRSTSWWNVTSREKSSLFSGGAECAPSERASFCSDRLSCCIGDEEALPICLVSNVVASLRAFSSFEPVVVIPTAAKLGSVGEIWGFFSINGFIFACRNQSKRRGSLVSRSSKNWNSSTLTTHVVGMCLGSSSSSFGGFRWIVLPGVLGLRFLLTVVPPANPRAPRQRSPGTRLQHLLLSSN